MPFTAAIVIDVAPVPMQLTAPLLVVKPLPRWVKLMLTVLPETVEPG